MDDKKLQEVMEALKRALQGVSFVDSGSIDVAGDSIDFDLDDGTSHWLEVF